MEESVILVVKAPNQQIEDQMVHCEVSWTVKRLKGHLAEVYPTKPRLEDQKLIYSGQLLNDSATLKDVLRVYEGQKNHTLHLVCSPPKDSSRGTPLESKKPSPANPSQPATQRNSSAIPPSTSSEGLRQRFGHVYNSPHPSSWPFSYAQPGAQTSPPVWPMFGTYDTANVAQQMAYMQQAYAQYMTQYMQLMASGNMPMPMGMPNVNAVPPAAPHPPPLREEPVPEPAPNADDEDVRVNQDWLDWFYVMSRMLVLFSIVYFYSSPVRFFVVSTLGIIMYLYQVGFFRAVHRQEQQDEAPATPPPTPDNNNAPAAPEAAPAPPSPLAVTWAAFSSFFLSLIPDQPNVL